MEEILDSASVTAIRMVNIAGEGGPTWKRYRKVLEWIAKRAQR